LLFVCSGLGNKTYEQFNAIGQFWDTKLAELGGTRLFDAGVGDDDGKYAFFFFVVFFGLVSYHQPSDSLEEDYVQWKDRMWPVLCKHFNIDMEAASNVTYVCFFQLKKRT